MNPKLITGSTVKKLIVLGIVAIVALWVFFSVTTTIGTGKIAVMTRFGKVTGQELGEGFHFKSPFDKANNYDIKVLKDQSQAAAASKDLQDVRSTLVINYRLEAGKVSEIHRTVGIYYKEKLIDPAVQEVFKGATARFDATQLITDRPAVKADAFNELVKRLGKYGIVVQDLSITNFSFSPEFTNAIESKQVAAQEAERAKFNLDKATLDAQSQNAQKTSLSPELLQKYAIDKWDGKMPQYLGGSSVFNIPLTK